MSLVEIMVALVAGLILSAGIMQIYLDSSRTYRTQEQLARLQENVRYALSQLTRDIRMGGSIGCASRLVATPVSTLNRSDTLYFNFERPVEGFEAVGTGPGQTYEIAKAFPAPSGQADAWAPALPEVQAPEPKLNEHVVLGSDVLVVRGAVTGGSVLQGIDASTVTIPVNSLRPDSCGGTTEVNGLCLGDLVALADCQTIRVFQITQLGENGTITHARSEGVPVGKEIKPPGNACEEWNGATPCNTATFMGLATPGLKGAPAEIAKLASTMYFVGRRDKTDNDPNPPPSLYRRVGTDDKEEIVEGVETMQVLYGVADDPFNPSSQRQYVAADRVANWRNVVSIRLSLLMRTQDEVADTKDENTYNVNGTTVTLKNKDRRLRRVVDFTASVRSRQQ